MLRRPLLWKRCYVSLVGGNWDNDKNVLVCFSFCLDTTHWYQKLWCFFFWFCFVSRDKNTQFWCIMKSRLVQRRGHKCHVSTLWRNYFLTFLETLRPDSWRTWSYRVHWLKAADFGSSIEDRQQYFQMFSSLVGQIRLALCSVKHIKILEHWNLSMTRQQVWI